MYTFAVLGDWLQGPYVYALYSMYNFSKLQIGQLFIAGFGSSMVFGIAIGSLTDRYGRKISCLAYCGIYVLSCMTKHYPSFVLLIIGRILGGIAYSILFTSFDSWLIAEHNRRGFPAEWLNQTYFLTPLYPLRAQARTHARTHGRRNTQTHQRSDGRMDKGTKEQMHTCTKARTGKWTDGRANERTHATYKTRITHATPPSAHGAHQLCGDDIDSRPRLRPSIA